MRLLIPLRINKYQISNMMEDKDIRRYHLTHFPPQKNPAYVNNLKLYSEKAARKGTVLVSFVVCVI